VQRAAGAALAVLIVQTEHFISTEDPVITGYGKGEIVIFQAE